MSTPTKERIKQAAFSYFALQGYEATSLTQIASRVGIKKPSLYAFFPSKEALFFEVYNEVVDEYKDLMERLLGKAEKEEVEPALFLLFKEYIIYFAKNPELSSFWNRVLLFPPTQLKERIYNHLTEIEGEFSIRIAAIFDKGRRQGIIRQSPLKDLNCSYRCIREGLLMLLLLNPGQDDQIIDRIWQDYWLGIRDR